MPTEQNTNKTKHKQGNVPIQHNKEEPKQHHTGQKAQTTIHHPPGRVSGDAAPACTPMLVVSENEEKWTRRTVFVA
jgi:hypothetical protein